MFLLILFPESRKFLLYARQIEIRGVDIDNPYYNYIISFTVPDIDNVTVVDYDAVEHRIYWSDVRTQTIKRAFINGTGVETVVSAGKNDYRNICLFFLSLFLFQFIVKTFCICLKNCSNPNHFHCGSNISQTFPMLTGWQ